MTDSGAGLFELDVDALLAEAKATDSRRNHEERARAARAVELAREQAARHLSSLWVRALRGVVDEPHAADGWDSGLRLAVAEALAARLLGYGVPADVVALLLSAWAAVYVEPPLEEDVVLRIVRGYASEPAREAA